VATAEKTPQHCRRDSHAVRGERAGEVDFGPLKVDAEGAGGRGGRIGLRERGISETFSPVSLFLVLSFLSLTLFPSKQTLPRDFPRVKPLSTTRMLIERARRCLLVAVTRLTLFLAVSFAPFSLLQDPSSLSSTSDHLPPSVKSLNPLRNPQRSTHLLTPSNPSLAVEFSFASVLRPNLPLRLRLAILSFQPSSTQIDEEETTMGRGGIEEAD
jgi:hypothetical protein